MVSRVSFLTLESLRNRNIKFSWQQSRQGTLRFLTKTFLTLNGGCTDSLRTSSKGDTPLSTLLSIGEVAGWIGGVYKFHIHPPVNSTGQNKEDSVGGGNERLVEE